MPEAVTTMLSVHLAEALGRPVDEQELTEDTALEALGLDSLSTISMLVGLSEECGVDLGDYADTLEPPRSVGDLLAVTARFMDDA